MTTASQRHREEAALLHETNAVVSRQRSLPATLNHILDNVAELVAYDAAEVSVYDRERELFISVVDRGELLAPMAGERVYPVAHSLSGWILQHRRPLHVTDAAWAELTASFPTLRYTVRTYLGMPLFADGEVVGTLELAAVRSAAFSEADERLVELIAAQAAQAIVNYRRPVVAGDERTAQFDGLQRITSALNTTLDDRRVLELVLDEALRMTAATQGAIALRQQETEQFRFTTIAGYDPAAEAVLRAWEFGDSLGGDMAASVALADHSNPDAIPTLRVVRTGHVLITDVGLNDVTAQGGSGVDVPIMHQKRIVGVLTLRAPQPLAFTPDQLPFLKLLADQAALAISNAVSFQDQLRQRELAQHRAQLLKEVLDIGNRQRTDQSLEDTLTDVAFGVMNAVGFRNVVLNLRDMQQTDLFQPMAFAGVTQDQIAFLRTHPLRGEFVAKLLNPRYQISQSFFLPADYTAHVLADEHDNPTISTFHDARTISEWQGEDMLVTPLYGANDQLMGLLSVDDPFDRQRPTRRTIDTLEIFANQAKVFIENARLYQETQRQLEDTRVLNQLAAAIGAPTTLPQLAIVLHHHIRQVLHTKDFYLAVYDPEHDLLEFPLAVKHGGITTMATRRGLTGMSGYLMTTQQPLLINERVAEEMTARGITAQGYWLDSVPCSFVGVPLLLNGRSIGALGVQDNDATWAFMPRDLQLLEAIAVQTAAGIEKVRLLAERERQVAQFKALSDIGKVTSTTLDIEAMFLQIYQEVARYRPVDVFLLSLFDLAAYEGRCDLSIDRGEPGFYYEPYPIRLNSYTDRLIRTNQPILTGNPDEEARYGIVPMVGGDDEPTLSWVGVLLRSTDGQPFGVLSMQSYASNAYDERDVEFLSNIANQVALNVQNARLFSQSRSQIQALEAESERMRLITRVSTAASSTLDMRTLTQLAVDEMGAAVGADQARMALFDRARGIGTVTAEQFPTGAVGTLSFPLEGNRSIAWMDEHHTALLVEDVQNDPGFQNMRTIFEAQGVGSLLVVPLIVNNVVIGSVGLDKAAPFGAYNMRHVETCQTIANQVAAAIENARLFESEQAKRQLADTLREVALSLTSTLDLNEVLEIVLEQLQRVVAYDSASVQLLRADNQLEIIAGRGLDNALIEGVTFPAHDPEHPNHEVLRTRRPYLVGDIQSRYPVFQRIEHAQAIRSWLGVPLIHGNQLLGMITLDSRQTHFYTAEMADLAFTFATQAATALGTARLFETIRSFNVELEGKVAARTVELTAEKERIEALHTITTTLTASLDSDEIVLRSLELAASAIGAQHGSILIRDAMHDTIVVRSSIHPTHGIAIMNQIVDLPDGGLAGWILEHQQGVRIADVQHDRRWALGPERNICSVLGMPLSATDVQLGVILLTSPEADVFTDEHLRLLQTIANEVAIALNNAELYDLINDQAARLAEMLQLQRQEASQNRAILESVAEGVLVIDDRNTVMLYNPAAAEVLRVPMDAIYGRSLDRLAEFGATPEDHQRGLLVYAGLNDGVRMTYTSAEPQNMTLELPGQTIAATFAPVSTADGIRMGTATVLRDISREIESDKSKRAFISTVSHELRTPLTSIKGYLDLLLINTAGPMNDMQRSFLEVVKTNADRLNALVQDLLEISRLENGNVQLNFSQFSFNGMIDDLLQSLRPETKRKNMEVVLDLDPLLPPVEADEKLVGQVVLNLLSNAHKYTFEGGTITVRTRMRDGELQVDVGDTGVGIAAADLPNMFSRFFRTDNPLKEVAGGTGLGLSIAKSFIELHHGTMWVTSVEGKGSTFSFTLPLMQPHADLDGSENLADMSVSAA